MGGSDAPSPPSPPSRDSHARLILVHRNKSCPSTLFSRDDRCDPGFFLYGDPWCWPQRPGFSFRETRLATA